MQWRKVIRVDGKKEKVFINLEQAVTIQPVNDDPFRPKAYTMILFESGLSEHVSEEATDILDGTNDTQPI